MLRAPGSNVSCSVQRSRPARKVTSQCDTVTLSDTWVTATLRTASQSWGYRSKSASVWYTPIAGLSGTCSRRWTVRIQVSLKQAEEEQERKSGGHGHDPGDMPGGRREGACEPVEVVSVEDGRRRQAQDVAGVERVGRDDVLVQQPDQELGGGVGRDEVDADEQALAAHLGDQVRAVGGDGARGEVEYLAAKVTGALDQAFGLDGTDGGGDRSCRERAACECRGVQQRIGVERREQLSGRDNAADGHHAAAEDLAREQHVRGDAGQVSAPPGAEPAHAGLDL